MSTLLQHRVKKLLARESELSHAKSLLDTIPSLVSLDSSGSSSVSSASLRLSLKSQLDHASRSVAESVLSDMESLLSALDELKMQADAMDRKCRHVLTYLESTEKTSNAFSSQAAALRAEKQSIQAELDATREFLDKYQVSSDDMTLLQGTGPLVETDSVVAFFQLVHRVQTIRTNCQTLVESNPSSSHLELLDNICLAQNLAFDKLYQWANIQCNRELDDDNTDSSGGVVEPSRLLPQAMRFLRDKPDFYNHCKETLLATHRTGLLRRFMQALSRGGANGIPRPIEIHAHDPLRYASEMLAWVHQTSISEQEYIKLFFDGDKKDDKDDDLHRILGVACAGLTRPLQIRLQQVVTSSGLLVVFGLVHVLAYYTSILSPLMPDSDLSLALIECSKMAESTFQQQWHAQLQSYQEALKDSLDFSLAVAHPTLDLTYKMGHILESYLDSLLPNGIDRTQVAKVLDPMANTVLAPTILKQSTLSRAETNVFLLNQLACVDATLRRFQDIAQVWLDKLQLAMVTAVDAIAASQAEAIQQKCNVIRLLESMKSPDTAQSLEADFVRGIVHDYCTQLLALQLPLLERISPPDWRHQVETRTASHLCTVYDEIHAYVAARPSVYPSGTLVHSPQEVRTILDLS
ncbi:Golgi transport complex subunit 6 [Aphanomyces cochlioides]|nr:Golgi transport complex subunit 6 [Aphanomyces cochlioides]